GAGAPHAHRAAGPYGTPPPAEAAPTALATSLSIASSGATPLSPAPALSGARAARYAVCAREADCAVRRAVLPRLSPVTWAPVSNTSVERKNRWSAARPAGRIEGMRCRPGPGGP